MNTPFDNEWNLWYHNSKDDWTINGYKKLYSIKNISDYWKLYNNWDKFGGVNNKHFFLMKNNVTPIWEDPANKSGGCWSFKINESNSQDLWNDLSLHLVTENMSSIKDDILGLSVCLKKNNFSVVKIWNKNNTNNSLNLLSKDILNKWGLDIIYIAHMPDVDV
jgi:hypothetical protein